MKVYKLTNIVYDTDGEPIDDLPTELILKVDDDCGIEDFDVEYEGADFISDETGFCVESFSYEDITEE